MAHAAELLNIAKRIQRQHPPIKRQSPFKRFNRFEEKKVGGEYVQTGAEALDQAVRDAIAEHLLERRAVLKRERGAEHKAIAGAATMAQKEVSLFNTYA
jgi:hypothetical protein